MMVMVIVVALLSVKNDDNVYIWYTTSIVQCPVSVRARFQELAQV